MSKLLYREQQAFRQPILIILFSGMNILWLAGIIQQVILNKPFGTNPASDPGLIIIAVVIIVMTILFFRIRMITEVRNDGVYYRFTLFQGKFRVITQPEIKTCEKVIFHPLKEYGGWGIKRKSRNDIAYSVSGNSGIRFMLYSGKTVLIGTQRPDFFYGSVQSMMKRS